MRRRAIGVQVNALSLRHAHWFSHVNGVDPTPEMRQWLTDTASLTAKLMARCGSFRVECLHQRQERCLIDECAALELSEPSRVWEREVLLRCDERPVVFAHTVVPLTATQSDWPLFSALGERSLGSTLFGDPKVERGTLQYARLRNGHPLYRRVCDAVGGELDCSSLYARRCLYRRRNGLLLLTEIFSPAVVDLNLISLKE